MVSECEEKYQVNNTGTIWQIVECGIHVTGVWEADPGGHRSGWWWKGPLLLTWLPQSAAAFGGGCRESQTSVSPWSVWEPAAPGAQ